MIRSRAGTGAMVGVLSLAAAGAAAQTPTIADFDPLVARIEAAARTADVEAYMGLLADGADRTAARAFTADALRRNVQEAAARGRFVRPLDDEAEGTGYELTVEVFTERGVAGRLQTWTVDVVRGDDTGDGPRDWRIAGQERVDVVEGLLNLTLNPDVAYDATNLVIAGEDMTLHMVRGSVFVAETNAGGITAMVLLGDGVLTFAPAPEAERGQVRLLTGRETLEADLSAAFVRLNPARFATRVSVDGLRARAVDRDELERAREIFDEFAPLSFGLDLGDLSDKAWSLTPGGGDFIADMQTDRYGTLTFAQSANQPEDVSLYERESQRIIALYSSAQKRAVQGRYYSEDDGVAYDVLDYRIAASFQPAGVARESMRAQPRLRGCFITGRTRLALRVTGPNLTSLTLRLAEDLEVHSVVSNELGPLLFFRMRGRDNVVVSLPSGVPPVGAEFTVEIEYSGLLEAQELDENWMGRRGFGLDSVGAIALFGIGAPRYIYSNSSYWYPRAGTSDYATATMDLTVPGDYGVVASGEPTDNNPPVWATNRDAAAGTRRFRYVTLQPARYLSCLISRFAPVADGTGMVTLDAAPETTGTVRHGVSYDSVRLVVESNERTRDRAGRFYDDAADILGFYASLVGDVPYPTFTLALTDAILPGGHSPAHFAVLNQPLPLPPGVMMSWRTDPVAFSSYPTFFLAHELAHQWWGQAVGWKNYHEQWLSEGLAQYFAALYAEHRSGPEVFSDVLAQMRRWSLRHSDQGPVYLGNRLGRIEDEPRVFRALVYNKGAMVLHMLRRLLGDDTFFAGIRRYYNEMRFRKAGTDDLIRAFETESGRSLTAFFDRWIHEDDLPDIDFRYRIESGSGGREAVLRFEQRGKLFEVPIAVTLRYRGNARETLVVPVAGEVTEVRVPLRGRLRDVEVNEDGGALVEIG